MEWQLVEVGLVTTLAIWVFLFSPSPASKVVAGIVFCVNLLLAMLERDRPRRTAGRKSPAPPADSHTGVKTGEVGDASAAGDPGATGQRTVGPTDSPPRRLI